MFKFFGTDPNPGLQRKCKSIETQLSNEKKSHDSTRNELYFSRKSYHTLSKRLEWKTQTIENLRKKIYDIEQLTKTKIKHLEDTNNFKSQEQKGLKEFKLHLFFLFF